MMQQQQQYQQQQQNRMVMGQEARVPPPHMMAENVPPMGPMGGPGGGPNGPNSYNGMANGHHMNNNHQMNPNFNQGPMGNQDFPQYGAMNPMQHGNHLHPSGQHQGMQLPPVSYIHKQDGMMGGMGPNGMMPPNGMNGGPGGGGPMMPPNGMNGMNGQPFSTSPNTGAVKQCAGCGSKIGDRYLLHSMDRYWHHACLKCTYCAATLVDIGSSCYSKGGMILCKNDYIRLFGSSGSCGACGVTIPASEFVMRCAASGRAYHLKCFTCSKCQNQLVPGNKYAIVDGAPVCEQDCAKLRGGPAAANGGTGPAPRKGKVGRPRRQRD